MTGVVYVSLGVGHLPRLMVSLSGLARVWAGPVAVVHPEWDDTGGRLEAVTSFYGARLVAAPCTRYTRHTAYCFKAAAPAYYPFERGVFLDADTLPVGPVDALVPRGAEEAVWTRFSNWTCRHRVMQKRLANWKDRTPDLWARPVRKNWPAINTGAYGFRKGSRFLTRWEELAARSPVFIADEIAAQLVFRDYPHRLLSDSWNLSPLFGRSRSSPAVWHFHGDKHLHPAASGVWEREFARCWAENAARCREWAPDADHRLKRVLERKKGRLK